MYDRALFLADSVVQLVLSENKAGRADAKIELSTIVSKVSSCPCLPQLRACFAVNMHQRRMHVAVKCQLICSIEGAADQHPAQMSRAKESCQDDEERADEDGM